MAESWDKRCLECGATLAPGRRYCLACRAPVAGAERRGEGKFDELMARMDTTHRPDKTVVFVPERKEARLRRQRRHRRALIAALISCIVLALAGYAFWRIRERQQTQARLQRRELMARQELGRYAAALDLFHADIGRYPTTKEGLSVLLRRSSTLAAWRGPYIEGDYSIDPWGNEYVYEVFNNGAGYQLFTYGPEGEAEGRVFLQVNSESSAPGPPLSK